MAKFLKKFDWKQIALILTATGVLTVSDPNAALISIVAVVIVAMINLVYKAQGKPVGRGWVTMLVYAAAFAIALAANPPAAGFPVWTGDPAAYTQQLAVLFAEMGPYALAMTGSATIIYNALSKQVIERIENKLLNG